MFHTFLSSCLLVTPVPPGTRTWCVWAASTLSLWNLLCPHLLPEALPSSQASDCKLCVSVAPAFLLPSTSAVASPGISSLSLSQVVVLVSWPAFLQRPPPWLPPRPSTQSSDGPAPKPAAAPYYLFERRNWGILSLAFKASEDPRFQRQFRAPRLLSIYLRMYPP